MWVSKTQLISFLKSKRHSWAPLLLLPHCNFPILLSFLYSSYYVWCLVRAPGTVFTFFVYLQQCRTKSKLADTAIHDALVLLLISHILVLLPLLWLLRRMTFPHTPCAHCARAKRNWHGLRRQRRRRGLRTYNDDNRKYKNRTQWWLSFEANADDDDVRRAPLIKVKNVKILESFHKASRGSVHLLQNILCT